MASGLKSILGHVPAAAVLYDTLRPRRPRTRYNLDQLAAYLPKAVAEIRPFAESSGRGKTLLLFATLHYWIEQAVVLGLALRAMGHTVTIAYLPYSSWEREINDFDLRRQDLYTRRVLAPIGDLVKYVSLLDFHGTKALPDDLALAVEKASCFDAMYSLQVEDVDRESSLFKLRMQRNRFACQAALQLLQDEAPDTVLIPNGLVTELGVVYQVARFLDLWTVTYEFNDQREQIWLAQNKIVMHQNTDGLWRSRGRRRLGEAEQKEIAAFEEARRGARTYGKGTRQWQDAPSQGSESLRAQLGLDDRPVVLLATNVLGDSLTLGRHVFASSMAEWIEKTVTYLVGRPDVQLVVRIHPGERLIRGPSIMRVIEQVSLDLTENIHTISASDKTNTYDLMDLASVGLVYTTTVGMEMAMKGLPVIVAGDTHYRNRGFTLEPTSWVEYFAMLEEVLGDPVRHRLRLEQVETAWNYAYRFFFEYPLDFPWRLMHFWQDIIEWPLERVLSDKGQVAFGRTFSYLAGDPIEW